MSSEGSVSSNGSRIRQFGLYRTIDSRTEEFLRSSRKRQIRQGCACAAISTAITVTVVISVILVYEYSITSGPNINKKTSFKPNWIGLMNDSDITSISSKFNKKINFDKTTLKLLPILLKALNKNQYLEKILEEYSSSPPYAGTDATEATFTRNFFSDSKNWLKLPTTRHYSTDYKTSPLMQWKTTQRLEYLTKIRKIRDYQRMLNYFDKMINDKVGIYQKKEFEYFTERPLTSGTIPMTKIDKYKNIQWLRNLPPTGKDANECGGCNCKKKLGLLLSKLIRSLQDLIPFIIGNKLGLNISCENKTKNIEGFQQLTTARTERPTKQRIYDIFSTIAPSTPKVKKNRPKVKKIRPKVTLQSRKCCSTSTTSTGTISKTTSTATKPTTSTAPQISTSTTTVATRETTTTPVQNELNYDIWKDSRIPIPTKEPLKLPNYQIYVKTTTDYHDLLTKPIETPKTQTTESVEIKRPTIKKIVPQKFKESTTERWLKPYKPDAFFPKVNVPFYKEEDYDDYFTIDNKLNKATKEFENIDVYGIESLKAKTMSSGENIGLGKKDKKINFEGTTDDGKPMNYHTITIQPDVDLTSMRKLADMLYLPQDKTTKVWKYTTDPEVSTTSYKKIIYPGTQATSTVTNSVKNSVDSTTSTISTNLAENSIDPTTSTIGTNSVENFVDSTTSIISTNSVENFDPTTSIIGTNSVENAVDPPISTMLPSSRKNIQLSDSAPDVKNYYHEAESKYHPNSFIQNELQIIENLGDDELQEEYMRPTESYRVPYKYKMSTKKNYTSIETTKQNGIETTKQTAPWEFMKKEEKIINKSTKSMLPALRPIYLEIQRNTEWKPEEHGDYDVYNFNNNIFDLPNIN